MMQASLKKVMEKAKPSKKAVKGNRLKRNESLQHLCKDFATSTSAHGVPHIVNSEHTYQKIGWTIACFITLGIFCWMIAGLIKLYVSKPVSTTVKVKHEKVINSMIMFFW